MEFRETVGISGKVKVQKRLCDTPRLQWLKEIYKQELEQGKRIMSDEDKRDWDEAINQEVETHNLTMTRCIDQMLSLFGRAYGFGLNTATDDRNSVGNNYFSSAIHAVAAYAPNAVDIFTHALFPEIIGIGYGTTVPTITDAALVHDFGEYRNTYNDKFGGYVKPGRTFKDDFICQYTCFYDTAEINTLHTPIYEIGLYSPEIQMGIFAIKNGEFIYFNRTNDAVGNFFASNNRLWSALNISIISNPGVFQAWYTLTRLVNLADATLTFEGFLGSRGGQIINISRPMSPANASMAVVAFTPRYDSTASQLGAPGLATVGWGINRDFGVGNLLARVVLPVGFIKNSNEILTVIWQMELGNFEV